MGRILVVTIVVLLMLLINEWWWRGRQHGEISRKWIHIAVGTFVAFWPFFLSWRQIELLSACFVVGVLCSKWLGVFKALHSVQRPTVGEILFGVAVGLTAMLARTPAMYAVALLYMSLADGLAAVVGVGYGAKQTYRILGSRKSLVGTATFFATACVLLLGYSLSGQYVPLIAIPLLLLGSTLIENLGTFGLDNLLVPLYVVLILSWLG